MHPFFSLWWQCIKLQNVVALSSYHIKAGEMEKQQYTWAALFVGMHLTLSCALCNVIFLMYLARKMLLLVLLSMLFMTKQLFLQMWNLQKEIFYLVECLEASFLWGDG